jgi:hypothetical protein
MAGGKYSSELLLQGKFEFDQSSLSEAAKFTQELVKTIERPLQEMAQRIVASIAGQGGIGQAGQIILTNRYGVPTGQGSGITEPPPPLPTQGQAGATGVQPGSPVSAEFIKQVRNEFRLPEHRIVEGIAKRMGEAYSPHQETANLAMFMKKAQGLGMDMYSQMSPEQKEQFKQSAEYKRKEMDLAVTVGREEQREFTRTIGKLEEAIRKLKEELPKKMGDELKEGEAKLGILEKQKQEAVKQASERSEETSAVLTGLARERSALQEPEIQERQAEEQRRQEAQMARSRSLARTFGVAQMAIQGMQFGNELPYMMEERRAASAQLERGSARALLSGDMERYQVIQELGGDEALAERSRRSSYMGAGLATAGAGLAGIAGSALAGSGALGAGLTGLGLTGVGMPLALAGAGIYGAYKFMNAESEATQLREREIQARTGQTQEFRQASARARARLEQSFDMATATGDRSLEMMFYGAGAPEARTPTGRSLFQSAAQRGVDYGQLAPVIAELGQRSRTTARAPFAAYSPMQDSINLASLGIGAQTQAGLLSAQDTATRLNPREAFAQIKDMYVEAYATGIEKSQLPKAMERFAGMAASIGFGGTNVAQEQMRRATSMAGAAFGEEYGLGQLDLATRAQKFQFGGGPLGSGGLGNALGIMATSGILESTKVGDKSLSGMLGGNAGVVSMMLAQQGQTDESMVQILTNVGGMTEQQAKEAVKNMGGAKGFTAQRESGQRGGLGAVGAPGVALMTAMGVGAEGGAQVGAITEMAKAAIKGTSPADTLEGRIKATSAREKVEAGEGVGPAGGKIKATRLGVEAEELEKVFDVLVKTLPNFSTAVSNASEAINTAISTMKEKSAQNFGN